MSKKTSVNATPLDAVYGANLKRLREAAKYSTERLAELMECSPAMINHLEQGERPWSTKWIWRAKEIFKVDPIEFMIGIEITSLERELLKSINSRIKVYETQALIENKS